jgi:hypothetical protein
MNFYKEADSKGRKNDFFESASALIYIAEYYISLPFTVRFVRT